MVSPVASVHSSGDVVLSPPKLGCRRRWKTIEHKVKVFANSLLGSFVLCQGAEVAGDYLGSSVGKVLGGLVLANALRITTLTMIFLAFNSVAVSPSRTSLAVAAVAIAAITAVASSFTLSRALVSEPHGGQVLGEYLGESIGSIVGGFVGLTLANCPVIFYDPLDRSPSYSVGMVRYKAVGYLFDRCIQTAAFPINIVRKGVKIFCQSMGYNSHLVIPACQEWARKKNFSRAFIPFAVELSCGRFYDANRRELSKKVMAWLTPSLNLMPSFLSQALHIMGSSVEPSIANELEQLSKQTARYTAFTMRGLYQYMQLLESPEIKVEAYDYHTLKQALLKEIPYARVLSRLITPELLSKFSDDLLEGIRQGELAALGFQVLSVEKFLVAKQQLAFHLKYFILFMIGNFKALFKQNELTAIEERDFLIEVNHRFWTIYGTTNSTAQGSRLIVGTILRAFYNTRNQFTRFVMRAEQQNTLVVSRPELNENHVVRPPTPPPRLLGGTYQAIEMKSYMPAESNCRRQRQLRLWKVFGF